jgi:dihydrodipicolinate synthase/N-acetylneuraminate lyase
MAAEPRSETTPHRERLRGIMPVLQVPFDEAGNIVEADLRSEVSFCIAAGVHGLVVPALASEFMVLTDDERRMLVEVTLDEAAGRSPVIAGVAAPSARGAAALASHASRAGAAAVMALPPYVRRPGPTGVIDYYAALHDASGLPIVLQNAPPAFASGVTPATLLDLLDRVPAVRYIKEERPPIGHNISAILAAASDRLLGVFGGTAGLYLISELERGATGCMPSAAVADVLVSIFDRFDARDLAGARDLHDSVLPALTLEMALLMAASKEMLRLRGVFRVAPTVRDPEFPDLDNRDILEIGQVWQRLEQIFPMRSAQPKDGSEDAKSPTARGGTAVSS